MKIQKIIPNITFFTCALTSVAYEAIKVNGYINRFCPDGCSQSFIEMTLSKWSWSSLLVYLAIFLPFLVVFHNKNNQQLRNAWFLFSLLLLVISCINIPNAMQGRWVSTSDFFSLFYLVVVPIPSIICVVIGVRSKNANQ